MSYTKDGLYEGETLNRSQLYEQAPKTAVDLYQIIEGKMRDSKGDAWVDAHPGVIAQMVVAASIDFNLGMMRVRIQELEKRLNAIASRD